MPMTLEQWYRQMPVVTRSYLTLSFLTTAGAPSSSSPHQRLLQLALHLQEGPAVAPLHQLLLLRQPGHGLRLPHVLPQPILPPPRGGHLPRPKRGLFLMLLSARRSSRRALHQHPVPRRIPHVHDGIRLGTTQPVRQHVLPRTLLLHAPYLPWVLLSSPSPSVPPVVASLWPGHAYYYLEDVYPTMTDRRLLRTPKVVKAMFGQADAGGEAWGVGNFVPERGQSVPRRRRRRGVARALGGGGEGGGNPSGGAIPQRGSIRIDRGRDARDGCPR